MKKREFKIIIFIIAFFVLKINVNASSGLTSVCTETDEYIKWSKMSSSEKKQYIEPMRCKEFSNIKNKYDGYNHGASYLDSSYNLTELNYSTSIKNQGDSNVCWAFAACSVIESNLIKSGKDALNLSEAHIEFSTQSDVVSGTRITYNRSFNSGGNGLTAINYFLNLWGPVLEDSFPFSKVVETMDSGSTTLTASDIENKKAVVDINGATLIQNSQGPCTSTAIAEMKKLIIEKGALASNIGMNAYSADGFDISADGTVTGPFVNGPYYSYDGSSFQVYMVDFDENQLSDHGISIVGWDDNILATDYSSSHQPTRNGAWIVKNSWGTSQEVEGINVKIGDEGYFYVSYDDVNICTLSYSINDVDLDVPDNVNSLNTLGFDDIYATDPGNNSIMISGKFTKQNTSGNEKLDKVNFGNLVPGTKYEVYYSENQTDLDKIAEGTTDNFGYIVVKPNKDITIKNSTYYITVKYISQTNNNISIPIAQKYSVTSLILYKLLLVIHFIH